MNKLNKIFYGPAGTGKTRRSIENAVQIVDNKSTLNSYENTLKIFKMASNPLSLNIDFEHIERIQNETNLEKIFDSIPRGVEISLEEMKRYKNNYNKYPLIETVTFHPSYTYQDFVEGISVENTDDNEIIYKVKDGIFKKICDRAIVNPDSNYVLIIDEINRGDISSIFGELFTLLEDSKRKGEVEELSINLPYSKDNKGNPEKLLVPNNLYILATMNTIDKSIALIDVALRRRFEFEECMPDYSLAELSNDKDMQLGKILKTINKRISVLKNENYQIGHSYFLNINNINDFREVMDKNIIPLLQEYFYDDWKSICAVLNQSYIKTEENRLLVSSQMNKTLFKSEFNELIEYQNTKNFKLKDIITIEDIKSIYLDEIYLDEDYKAHVTDLSNHFNS